MSKKENFISYQLVYEETSKITIKKKMIRIYNKIIGQQQIIRKEIRKKPTLKYKKENWIFLKRNLERKNRFS